MTQKYRAMGYVPPKAKPSRTYKGWVIVTRNGSPLMGTFALYKKDSMECHRYLSSIDKDSPPDWSHFEAMGYCAIKATLMIE